MGYLRDNLPLGTSVADCPELYPYALVVTWVDNDKFGAPQPTDLIGFAVKEVLSDTEDWQFSVIKHRENRLKLRFKNEGTRDTAQAKLATQPESSIFINQLEPLNPPDLPIRGVA